MVKIREINSETASHYLYSETPRHILEEYNAAYDLNEGKIDFYRKNGFVKVEKLLEGEALNYARKVIESAVFVRKEHDARILSEKSEYEKSFLQCGFLCWDYPAVKDIVFSRRFARIAKELMEVDSVRLWHDQALFKEPGGRLTDVHQDCSYWPVEDPAHTTTMWLALNDATVDNGCLFFHPGTHKIGLIEYVDIFKAPHVPDSLKNLDKIAVPLSSGDASFHSGLTFHGAGNNVTNELREGMTVIYLKNGSMFDGNDKRNATHKSCTGLSHGDKIDTQFTPILY